MKPRAYYNDNEAFVCEWLRNLIKAGLIPDGDVDNRSIRDVRPEDLRGYTQCHFFAGIGGWAYALRLAGWPDDRPVWTGSCPCQPFSSAGKQLGFEDERHLWPAWFDLIRECRPSTIFGEQVARAVGLGWLDAVAVDLEGQGYSFGAAVLPACAVAAPHERERLWFVADANCRGQPLGAKFDGQQEVDTADRHPCRSHAYGLCDAVAHANFDTRRQGRTIEPDVGRVAHGVSARVGKLRALGNAIVPQVAAEFVGAYLDTIS